MQTHILTKEDEQVFDPHYRETVHPDDPRVAQAEADYAARNGITLRKKIPEGKSVPLGHPDRFINRLNGRRELPKFDHFHSVQTTGPKWLWHERIPTGVVTVIQGPAGAGKSFVAQFLAAATSSGVWSQEPEGTRHEQNLVVWLGRQDPVEMTLLPRLRNLGVDVDRICRLDQIVEQDRNTNELKEYRDVALPGDLGQVEMYIQNSSKGGGRPLLVIDPITDFCESDKDLRKTMIELRRLAATYKIAIVVTLQTAPRRRSGPGKLPARVRKGLESVRCVWEIFQDERDAELRYLLPVRMNFCKLSDKGLSFRIVEGKLEWAPLPASSVDDKLLEQQEAEAFLRDQVKDRPARMVDVMRDAEGAGIRKSAILKAKRALGIVSQKQGFGGLGGWWWGLPENINNIPSPAEIEDKKIAAYMTAVRGKMPAAGQSADEAELEDDLDDNADEETTDEALGDDSEVDIIENVPGVEAETTWDEDWSEWDDWDIDPENFTEADLQEATQRLLVRMQELSATPVAGGIDYKTLSSMPADRWKAWVRAYFVERGVEVKA